MACNDLTLADLRGSIADPHHNGAFFLGALAGSCTFIVHSSVGMMENRRVEVPYIGINDMRIA